MPKSTKQPDFNLLYFEKLKEHKELRRGTIAFTGVLMYDGKKVADISNDGGGGCHREYWVDREFEKAFYAWAATLEDYRDEETVLPMDGEFFLTNLMTATLDAKDVERAIKRKCKTAMLIAYKGDKFGEFRTVKAPFTPENKAKLTAQCGDKLAFFYNDYEWPKRIHYPCKQKTDAQEKPIPDKAEKA